MRHLLMLAAALAASPAYAERIASLPNEGGGEVVLTTSKPAMCGGQQLLAITTHREGHVLRGCWSVEAGYALIDWRDGARTLSRAYPLNDFEIDPAFAARIDAEEAASRWPQARTVTP